MIDFSYPFDVLVIGGGNAALSAAIAARRAGASVLVVEHAPRHFRGGNSRHTRNFRCMHDAPLDVLTGAYPEEEYWDDLLRVTQGRTDEHLARVTIRGSRDAFAFLAGCGVKFQPALSGTLSLSRTNAFFLGGGKALLNTLYALAERLGVTIVYDTEARALTLDGDVACGAELTSQGFPQTVRARSVIVASGGFQANLAWLADAWGPAAENFLIRGTPYAQGTILKNLMQQGVATVGDPTQGHAVAIDARAPKFDGGIATRLDCVPFSIVVNRDAQRFYDEGEDIWPKRYAIWGRLVAQQPGQIAYAVFDAKSEDEFMPSIFPAIRAATIEELAVALTLDPLALRATVDAYNAAVREGEFHATSLDDGCHTQGLTPPKSHWARPIDRPPFTGYPLRPGITFTYLGLKVDDRAGVLLESGRRVRNVWAAGEVMAGNILGQGYTAGAGMAIGTVFGRIAGSEAARYAVA
jgi:tricarballylate dehydrogenase